MRIGGIILAAAASMLVARAWATNGGPTPSWRVPAGDIRRGEALAQTCLGCHGAEAPLAAGLAVQPPRLHHQRQSYIFFALRQYRDGMRKSDIMQPFAASLSDQEMRDLAAYFAQAFPTVPPKPETGAPIYRLTSRECGFCHGETGIGEMEGLPVLAGQDPDYLRHALAAYRDGSRSDATMRAEVKRIDPRDDAAIAAYFATYRWLEHGK